MKIKISKIETGQYHYVYGPIEIETTDWDDFNGMSFDEIKEHIKKKSFEIEAKNDEIYDSLGRELMDLDLIDDSRSEDNNYFEFEIIK
jgi:hypothetical protein